MVNVRTGSSMTRDIAATTAEESTPPDRKAPSGTSLCRCRRTVAVNVSRNRSSGWFAASNTLQRRRMQT